MDLGTLFSGVVVGAIVAPWSYIGLAGVGEAVRQPSHAGEPTVRIYRLHNPTDRVFADSYYGNLLCTIPGLHAVRVKRLPLSD